VFARHVEPQFVVRQQDGLVVGKFLLQAFKQGHAVAQVQSNQDVVKDKESQRVCGGWIGVC
jgi:hypothetical protein